MARALLLYAASALLIAHAPPHLGAKTARRLRMSRAPCLAPNAPTGSLIFGLEIGMSSMSNVRPWLSHTHASN
jgi:hypothetical protein